MLGFVIIIQLGVLIVMNWAILYWIELECKHGEKHQQQQLFSTYKQMLDNVTALQQQFDAIKSRTLATELTRQVYVSQL